MLILPLETYAVMVDEGAVVRGRSPEDRAQRDGCALRAIL